MSLSSCREVGKAGTVESEFPSRFSRFSRVRFWKLGEEGVRDIGSLQTRARPSDLGLLGVALGSSCPWDTLIGLHRDFLVPTWTRPVWGIPEPS